MKLSTMHKRITLAALAIITVLIILSMAVTAKGQSKPMTDTIPVPTNTLQLEKLGTIQQKINEDQKAFNEILELIFGVKIEDVQWWGFDPKGQFKYVLKPKKK